ncbi:Serine/threonine-protein kinase 11-interacting protein, partial [Globisporangium splendens]
MRNAARVRRELQRQKWEQMRAEDIEVDVDDDDDNEQFLKRLEETLQQRMEFLDQSFLVLRAKQINYVALRLHEALEPKRDADTQLIQAWTIQPQVQMKFKMNTHIQVLKLSTIFREVKCLRLHQQSGVRTAIEMEIFPSLRSIEALQTQITALQHVHYFARQLRFLHVEQTEMDALRQVLAPSHAENKSDPVVPWRCLKVLQLNCCALPSVDKSVNQLEVIKQLDFGWNEIQKFEVPLLTPTLEVLNLCHNLLREVPPIQSLERLRELDLSVNKIKSLRGLEALVSLEVLDVSHNLLDRITDVELLVPLHKLHRLVLQHNPIARRPDYRREVLFYLNEGIELDGTEWSAAELLSMKKSRRLQTVLDNNESALSWGEPVVPDGAASTVAPSDTGSSTWNEAKLVLTYPLLPVTTSMTPHIAEIRSAPSMLSPRFRPTQQQFGGGQPARSQSSSRLATIDDIERASYRIDDDEEEDDAFGGSRFRTVDDFFTSRDDFIVVLDTDLVDMRVDTLAAETDISDEDSDSSSEEGCNRSRKYTMSDFMRDFEEEESLFLEGTAPSEADLLMARKNSHGRRKRRESALSIRVLLGADEASKYDLIFGIDGIPATLDLKTHEIIETSHPNDRETPICITRSLPDLVAVGSSSHSSRARIVTLKMRTPLNQLVEVTYQIDSIVTLERVLASTIGYLHQQKPSPPVICVCANCGAVSHCTREYLVHFVPGTPLSSGATDPFILYSCLLCNSFNVREVTFERMIAVYSADGMTLSAKRVQSTPLPIPETGDGFYIEEAEIDASEALDMYECVMISSNGVREVMVPSSSFSEADDVVTNHAREEAIVQAITMK